MHEESIMNLEAVKKIAKQRGLKISNLKKTELIRAIQQDEGNTACYNTDTAACCGQEDCLWRDDCR